jgi:uncharacterized protein (DUF1015 family)
MAVVAPFKAVRYNPDKVADMRKVVAPPYDVISPKEQEGFYQADPHNIIRIELNKTRESDDAEDNRYTRAADHLEHWLQEGVLQCDPRPAFYYSETEYKDLDGNTNTRRGFFTLIKVVDFSERIVLPHERTFTGHKEDRLKLTKATGANISPIFALYPDDANEVQHALHGAMNPVPLNDFVDPMGLRQRLYAVDEPMARDRVIELMADKVIFIADGHHRYETAINYRNYMREQYPDAGPDAPWEYVMVYLCSMSDPGLTIFPCHRVLPKLDLFEARDFLIHAKKHFDFQEIPIEGDMDHAKKRFHEALQEAGNKGRSFGLASTEANAFYVFTLKNDPGDSSWQDLDGPLKDLDVEVLTNVVLEHILGLDNNWRDQTHTISYVCDGSQVIDDVRTGKSKVGFLLNPTRIEQVQSIAEAGLIMPRKTTYFYPKVLTGLTINLVNPSRVMPLLSC